MGRISKLNERRLIRLVAAGEWEIDAEGRIWRTCVHKGKKNGGSILVPVERRRVERQLPNEYLQVCAMIDGRRVYVLAHRLVWQHFKGDIPPGEEINHDNGLKDDNRPNNLLCGTGGDNVEHAHRTGLRDQHGQRNPAAKLTDNQVAQIRLAYDRGGYTMQQLADRFGVQFQHISRLVKGQRRPKQGGPTANGDLRHCSSERDGSTGRFAKRIDKEAA